MNYEWGEVIMNYELGGYEWFGVIYLILVSYKFS